MTPNGYTVRDAATKLGIEYKALLKRIERGSVKTCRLSEADQSAHIIPPEEFDRLKQAVDRRSTRGGIAK